MDKANRSSSRFFRSLLSDAFQCFGERALNFHTNTKVTHVLFCANVLETFRRPPELDFSYLLYIEYTLDINFICKLFLVVAQIIFSLICSVR